MKVQTIIKSLINQSLIDYYQLLQGQNFCVSVANFELLHENPSVWIFSVPFSLKGSSKCTNHVNVHKLYAVEFINTVCSLDYPFQIRIF